MILYYSGTGNSKYAAEKIAKITGDETVCLNTLIKAGGVSRIKSDGRLVFVTPTYAWRIPRIVKQWIYSAEIERNQKAWFVMTCGSETGNASKYNAEICERRGFNYMGTLQVVMPENYVAMFAVPEEDECREIIAAADPVIEAGAERIAAGEAFDKPRDNIYDRFMSAAVNPIFYKFCVKADAFTVGDECIGCGLCERLCPTNSIKLSNGKPVWGAGCTHCMACICHCPKEAIEYGKASKGKPRYHID